MSQCRLTHFPFPPSPVVYPNGAWFMSHILCSIQSVTCSVSQCCLIYVPCPPSHVTIFQCPIFHVPYSMSHIPCPMVRAPFPISQYCMTHVSYPVSHLVCPMFRVPRPVFLVPCSLFLVPGTMSRVCWVGCGVEAIVPRRSAAVHPQLPPPRAAEAPHVRRGDAPGRR